MKIYTKSYSSNIEAWTEEPNSNHTFHIDGDHLSIYSDTDVYDTVDDAIDDARSDFRDELIEAFSNSTADEIDDALITIMIYVSSSIYAVWRSFYCANNLENKIKAMRASSGMSQRQFSDYLGIPVKTIQNWEIERNKCPEYLLNLIEYKLKGEKKI